MMYVQPRKRCRTSRKRRRTNARALSQSPVAINVLCRDGGAAGCGVAQKPGAGKLLVVDRGISEALSSILTADRDRYQHPLAERAHDDAGRSVFGDGGHRGA